MKGTFRLGELHLAGADAVHRADWIVAGVSGRYEVRSLLPDGFGAYARVFHPAARQLGGGEWTGVPWAEVAAANGRTAHAAMEWIAITGGWRYLDSATQPGVWDQAPSQGSLPVGQAAVLADTLSGFTKTPRECWFAVWDGSGAPAYPRETAVTVQLPQRTMVLFTGPLTGITTSFDRPPFDQRAHLWWPQDRSWCVATDTDLMTTYVAGSAHSIAAVVAAAGLESFYVAADQKITWDSDTVNPPLPPPLAGNDS